MMIGEAIFCIKGCCNHVNIGFVFKVSNFNSPCYIRLDQPYPNLQTILVRVQFQAQVKFVIFQCVSHDGRWVLEWKKCEDVYT